MTLHDAVHRDPLIGAYLAFAFLYCVYVACRIANVLVPFLWRHLATPFYRLRTRRLLRKWRQQDARRRETHLVGDALIDAIRQRYDGLPPLESMKPRPSSRSFSLTRRW